MTKVTYVPPNEPGFPASTVWNEIPFHANVPVELDPHNERHGYMVPIVKHWIDPTTQEKRSKAKDEWVSMIEIARSHSHFRVEGEFVAPRRGVGRPRKPTTSEEYRDYAIGWIGDADDPILLAERWNDEETLRQRCGVGDEDISYLRPMFDAKHHELKKQAV
jgi:hypothetical protein